MAWGVEENGLVCDSGLVHDVWQSQAVALAVSVARADEVVKLRGWSHCEVVTTGYATLWTTL